MRLLYRQTLLICLLLGTYPWAGQTVSAQTPAPETAVAYNLMDHRGVAVSEKTYLGKFQIVTFGYTYCPDVCPVTLSTLAEILNLLGSDVERVQALFITLDPKRDTPEQLAGYVEHFHPRLIGLTGNPDQIQQVADAYQIKFRASVPDEDGDYLLEHSAAHLLIDANGINQGHMAFNVSAEAAAQAIKEMLTVTGG